MVPINDKPESEQTVPGCTSKNHGRARPGCASRGLSGLVPLTAVRVALDEWQLRWGDDSLIVVENYTNHGAWKKATSFGELGCRLCGRMDGIEPCRRQSRRACYRLCSSLQPCGQSTLVDADSRTLIPSSASSTLRHMPPV